MSNVKFYWKNFIDSSSGYTTDSENAQFPVTNLIDPRTTKEVRSAEGNNTLDIIVDAQQAVAVDSVVFSPNALEGWGFDSVIVYGNSTSGFDTPDFTSSTLTIDHEWSFAKLEFTEESHRYWKFSFSGGGDYVAVSSVFLGKYTQLSNNNWGYNWTYVDEDRTDVSTSSWGNRFIDRRNTVKKLTGGFDVLNKAEYDTIMEIYDNCGKYRPLWFIVDDSETIVNDKERFAGYFYFTSVPQTTNRAFSLYDISMNMVEAI